MLLLRGAMLQQEATPVAERGSLLGDISRFFNCLEMETDALELLKCLSGEVAMTKEKWLLLGALVVGLLVVLYVVFLCPSDCH